MKVSRDPFVTDREEPETLVFILPAPAFVHYALGTAGTLAITGSSASLTIL